MSTNYAGDKVATYQNYAGDTVIERARKQVNQLYDSCRGDDTARATTLTALATAEALTRIAVALERVAREIDEDADAIRNSRTTD